MVSRSPGQTADDAAVEDALAALRSEGGRVTAAKRRIVEILHDATTPLTADDLHRQVPTVDQASVYRTLAQLEELGVVNHRHLMHGPAMYRWAGVDTIPIVCEGCGAIVELGASEYRTLAKHAKARGMTLVPGHFALSGCCDGCA